MADKNKTGDFYTRPEKATAKSLWDSDKGEFLGRNGASWGKLYAASFFKIPVSLIQDQA